MINSLQYKDTLQISQILKISFLIASQVDPSVCVPVYWLCDGVAHCPDASDEAGCSCEDWGLVECTGKDNSTQCMPEHWALHDHPLCNKGAGNVTLAESSVETVRGNNSRSTDHALLLNTHQNNKVHFFLILFLIFNV